MTPTLVPHTECTGLIPESIKARVRQDVDLRLNVGIVVGIVCPCGTEVYAYGKTALSGGQTVDENTVFEIGSIGKPFTALLLADMVERNEVSFDDPIERFLPTSVSAPTHNGRSITLIDLATHTSGLPNIPDNLTPADEYNPYADYTAEQMYEALAQTCLKHSIGSQYEYSNFGMGLLGHVLSLQSGMSYEELVVTRIADELGMPDTRVTLTPPMRSRLATGYRDGEPFPLWDNPTLAGAGALRSTVRDMLTFLAANMGLIESSLYETMQVTHEPRYQVDGSMEVGLGWHIRTQDDVQIVEHHGATGGYWSFAGFVKGKQTGVVVLTNTFHDIDEIGLDLLRTAATRPPASTGTPQTTEPGGPSFLGMINYGGTQDDAAWDALLAEDSGFYIVGATNLEFEPEMRGDVYLIRTDAAGEVLWEKTYGGEGYQEGKSIIPTSDGGVVIAGHTTAFGGGGLDAYLIKVDQEGNELWSRTYGSPLDEMASTVRQTADGGYILIGNVVDPNDFVAHADEAGYGGFEGRSNIYLVKTDGDGNELWSHAYDSENNILTSSGLQTADGGFLVLATVMFFPEPDEDILLLKVGETGNQLWTRTWEEGISTGHDLISTADGNYLIAGSQAPPGDIQHLGADSLFIKVDPSGGEIWSSVHGDSGIIDFAAVVAETTDGGFVAAGGAADIPLVRIDADGQLLWRRIVRTGTHSMFGSILQHPDGGYIVVGSSFSGSTFDIFVVKTDAQGNVPE